MVKGYSMDIVGAVKEVFSQIWIVLVAGVKKGVLLLQSLPIYVKWGFLLIVILVMVAIVWSVYKNHNSWRHVSH